jgi:hypothetical protein
VVNMISTIPVYSHQHQVKVKESVGKFKAIEILRQGDRWRVFRLNMWSGMEL